MGNKGSLLGLTAVCIFGSIIFTNLGAMVGLWVMWVRGSANSGELAGGSKSAATGVVGSSKLVLGAGGNGLSDQTTPMPNTTPIPPGECSTSPKLGAMEACMHQGVEYTCWLLPGKWRDGSNGGYKSPGGDCLEGRHAAGPCKDGEFLCKKLPLQPDEPIHTVFSATSSRYMEWQVRYHTYWHRKSGQRGGLTRLLSSNQPDHLMDEVPTWVAPRALQLAKDNYSPYNKPMAIDHWLRHSGVNAEYIIIVDPDCVFLRPLVTPREGGGVQVSLGNGKMQKVARGRPFGQKGYMDWKEGGPFESLTKKYCEGCGVVDSLAVPVVIHNEDLRQVAPLWLSITEQIRNDQGQWLESWREKQFALGWTAEMFGYIFGAAKLNIIHSVNDKGQDIAGVPHDKKLKSAVLHYSLKISLKSGGVWHKASWDAPTNIPQPDKDDDNQIDVRLLKELIDARDHLPRSNYTFPAQFQYYGEQFAGPLEKI